MKILFNFESYGKKIYEQSTPRSSVDAAGLGLDADTDITSWKNMDSLQLSNAAYKRMWRTRKRMTVKYQYFIYFIKSLDFIENDSIGGTMATDGYNIYYDPRFVMTHTGPELTWVIVHEILHCVLKHMIRRKGDRLLWNYAADYAINQRIETDEACVMPKGALGSPDDPIGKETVEKFRGHTAEAIYDYMLKNGIKPPHEEGWNFGNSDPWEDIPDARPPGKRPPTKGGAPTLEDFGRVGDFVKIKGGGYGEIISIDGDTGEADVKELTKTEMIDEIEKLSGKKIKKIIG